VHLSTPGRWRRLRRQLVYAGPKPPAVQQTEQVGALRRDDAVLCNLPPPAVCASLLPRLRRLEFVAKVVAEDSVHDGLHGLCGERGPWWEFLVRDLAQGAYPEALVARQKPLNVFCRDDPVFGEGPCGFLLVVEQAGFDDAELLEDGQSVLVAQ